MTSADSYILQTMPRICANCANRAGQSRQCSRYRDPWTAVRSGMCPYAAENTERRKCGRKRKSDSKSTKESATAGAK